MVCSSALMTRLRAYSPPVCETRRLLRYYPQPSKLMFTFQVRPITSVLLANNVVLEGSHGTLWTSRVYLTAQAPNERKIEVK